jgi:hypothetical protein
MITVTQLNKERVFQCIEPGGRVCDGSLSVTGLVEGDNIIPHGLPTTLERITLRPGAAGGWGETRVPDAVNLYITVATGGATSGTIDYKRSVT